MRMREVFVCDFGEIDLPETPLVRMKRNGWPDRRYKEGRRYQAYLNALVEMATDAYFKGGWLLNAPPFSQWGRQ